MSIASPELLVQTDCHTGECPLWHPGNNCLYWVDIPRARLFRHDLSSGDTKMFDTGAPAGGITLHSDGRLLLFMAEGAVRLWEEDGMETVVEALPEERGNRFNDVIADAEGRVYCGVMSTSRRAGRLYRIDADGDISVMIEGTGTANGMGFSPDLKLMYFCDSGLRTISVFDYCRKDGSLKRRRLFFKPSREDEGKPDGMTVDAEGCVWSARWNGGRLARHAPDGHVMEEYFFPVGKVSCVTFGGPDYSDIFITTAGGDDPGMNGKLAGSVFRLKTGTCGRPEFTSRVPSSRS